MYTLPNKPLRPVLAALLLSTLGPAAIAQNMDALEARLLEHPTLNAMRYDSDALRERAQAATGLPDPVISFGVNNFPVFDPSFDTFLPTNKAISVRQQFPNKAGREARSEEVQQRTVQNDAAIDMRFAELRAALQIALIEKRRIETQRMLAEEREAKYTELEDIVQTEIDAGRPVVFRLAEIDIERAEVAIVLAELQGQLSQVEAQLINLVGLVPETAAPVISALDWKGDAQAFHLVRVSEKAIDVADAGVDKAKADFRPNWGAQLTYQQRDEGNGAPGSTFAGDDWVSGAVTFTIPLWADSRQAPALRAAQADREAARARYLAATRTASVQYATYNAKRRAAEENIAVFQQKIDAIADQVAAQLTTYESGVGDYSPIIDGEIASIAFRAQIALEQSRRDIAIARMNALLVSQ
ncbi:TolC family protein [Hirschia baltica]|uniref:Outer membrane efflux protein n=1 Tax=Hirschia baltica (strain ATCC 49814 / DSM 5838 / IFAM 1418) TaxID=582402 RepID=C6XPA6_HIRBI|nr:TolC family protein [Hirschia baltica]ACT58392.1 outer membrane efflux protein [Hirschia baltica ATCC 49814]